MLIANTCCFDASAFSLGFACTHPGTLLLEKSENVLSDYVNAVIPGSISEPQTEAGRSFVAFLKKKDCISEFGIPDSPSLAPAAAEYALNYHILLGANVVSCEKTDSGYHILLHTNSGLQNVCCQQIIRRPIKNNSIKFLNAIVSGTERETLSKTETSGAIIHNSFEKDEYILSMPFAPELTLNEARIRFVEKMRECFGASVKIDAFAADFAVGKACGDLIKDFEAGVIYDI